MGKDPGETLQAQTPGNHRICVDICIIIEINKLVMQRLPKNGKRDRRQHKANPQRPPALIPAVRANRGF